MVFECMDLLLLYWCDGLPNRAHDDLLFVTEVGFTKKNVHICSIFGVDLL